MTQGRLKIWNEGAAEWEYVNAPDGGAQPAYGVITTAGGVGGTGGVAWVPLLATQTGIYQDSYGAAALPFVPLNAGNSLRGAAFADPEFAAAHAMDLYAGFQVANLDGTQRLICGLDANVPINADGSIDWTGAVWDVFQQVGADLSQADGIAPTIVSAAGGLFSIAVGCTFNVL